MQIRQSHLSDDFAFGTSNSYTRDGVFAQLFLSLAGFNPEQGFDEIKDIAADGSSLNILKRGKN